MDDAFKAQQDPIRSQIIELTANIQALPLNLIELQNILNAINYLDIEILKQPLANIFVKYLHTILNGDRATIETAIKNLTTPSNLNPSKLTPLELTQAEVAEITALTTAPEKLDPSERFTVSDELKSLLAKYWYLNYGNNKNYILPDFDYGFSIQELLDFGKLPKITSRAEVLMGDWGHFPPSDSLDLSYLRLNDITGFKDIPKIQTVDTLYLSHNKLTELRPDIFSGLKLLRSLDLSTNPFKPGQIEAVRMYLYKLHHTSLLV
jgi:hypothetical protein